MKTNAKIDEGFNFFFPQRKWTQRTRAFAEGNENLKVCFWNLPVNKSVDIPKKQSQRKCNSKRKNKKVKTEACYECNKRWRNDPWLRCINGIHCGVETGKKKPNMLQHETFKGCRDTWTKTSFFFSTKKKKRNIVEPQNQVLELWRWPRRQKAPTFMKIPFHDRSRGNRIPTEVRPDFVKFASVWGWENRA